MPMPRMSVQLLVCAPTGQVLAGGGVYLSVKVHVQKSPSLTVRLAGSPVISSGPRQVALSSDQPGGKLISVME